MAPHAGAPAGRRGSRAARRSRPASSTPSISWRLNFACSKRTSGGRPRRRGRSGRAGSAAGTRAASRSAAGAARAARARPPSARRRRSPRGARPARPRGRRSRRPSTPRGPRPRSGRPSGGSPLRRLRRRRRLSSEHGRLRRGRDGDPEDDPLEVRRVLRRRRFGLGVVAARSGRSSARCRLPKMCPWWRLM